MEALFDLAIKRSKVNLLASFEQLAYLESLMLYIKIQPNSFLESGDF